jgi:deazaflavin-dependent oxidoreductase (nitroreductase family)
LTHVGRRSGVRHQTVLEVMEYRNHGKNADPEIIVMSGFGRNANWLLNIEATPEAEVTIGGRHFAAAHRILDVDEAVKVVRGYEQRNQLLAPIIRSVLSRLLGWKYFGSESDHRRLVAQLPLVAFSPRS